MIKEIWNTLTGKGKRSLLFSIVCFTVYALSGTAMMLLTLYAIEAIFTGNARLYRYWPLLTLCLFIKGGSNMIADMQKHFAGFDLVYEIRTKIIYRLKTFSLGFYTNERLGEIGTIIHRDVDNMEMIVAHVWTRMCADFIVSLLLLVFLFSVNAAMTLIMLGILPFALLFLSHALKKADMLEEKTGNSLADMVSLFVEYVKGIPLLKAFFESKQFDEKLAAATKDFGVHSKRASKNKAAVLSVYGFFIDFAFWLTALAGIIFTVRKSLSIAEYLIFIVLSREFYKPFVAMEMHWANYLKAADSFRRIKKITEAPAVIEIAEPEKPDGFSVTFDKVGFAYEADGFVLKDISFHTPEHTLTALVGESGSGKTTVTNLLLRFWDAATGTVKIGNTDIRNMSYDELLSSVSIVMQNTQLFADTIEGNIRLGKADATEAEVVAAARKARIHDFIMSLSDGYLTHIGENGAGLSGGQKQRISIARAFLKDSPILLLDEMTSNVDPVNEALIQEAISELAAHRTVLVIAHHLSTIRSADRILVFKNGEIIQAGKHDALLADTNGSYYRLWSQGTHHRTVSLP
ncbi:ABC transporter ATP-binding protein [Treponema socranskii]|uniref:ABC transporter ATP-binding protein n=1 Tax=Treponema socranskii TaxID=53419 RepID=UPI003D941118